MFYVTLMRHNWTHHAYVAGVSRSISAAHRIGDIEAGDRGGTKYDYEVQPFLRLNHAEKFRPHRKSTPPRKSRYLHRVAIKRYLTGYKRGGRWASHC